MITNIVTSLLYSTIRLVLSFWRHIRSNSSSVAPRQCFTDGDYGSLAVAIEYKLVATPAWVSPCLQLLVHVLHQPAQASLFPESLMVDRPHVVVAIFLSNITMRRVLGRKCHRLLGIPLLLATLI